MADVKVLRFFHRVKNDKPTTHIRLNVVDDYTERYS